MNLLVWFTGNFNRTNYLLLFTLVILAIHHIYQQLFHSVLAIFSTMIIVSDGLFCHQGWLFNINSQLCDFIATCTLHTECRGHIEFHHKYVKKCQNSLIVCPYLESWKRRHNDLQTIGYVRSSGSWDTYSIHSWTKWPNIFRHWNLLLTCSYGKQP